MNTPITVLPQAWDVSLESTTNQLDWLIGENVVGTSQKTRFVLAISDEDLRHPDVLKNAVPFDFSNIRISDEDLR